MADLLCLRLERDVDLDVVVVQLVRGEKRVDTKLRMKESSKRLYEAVSMQNIMRQNVNPHRGTPSRQHL